MADTNPIKKRRNWIRITLVLSLALNLLVAGLVIGALLHGPRDRDRNPALRDLGYGPFVAALPRGDRDEMHQAMTREAEAFRANRDQMRAMFEGFLGALRAQPYDPDALRRIVMDQQTKVAERQELGRELLLDRINAMDAAERVTYADALDRSLRRGGKRHLRDRN